MRDVEKYGLFAVVLVGGLLLVIAVQGGFSSHGDGKAVADDVLPVIMDSPAPLHAQAGGGEGRVVRVKSILPEKPFQWDESPAPYPGERSSGAPATVTPLSAATATPIAPASATPIAAPASGSHAVAAGETLSDIAEKYLGSPNKWQELVKLNPGLNPKKLQIGQVLRVAGEAPAAPAPVAAAPTAPAKAVAKATDKPADAKAPASKAPTAAKGKTHVVVSGDTLSSIAKKYLGSATRADDIYAANRDVLKSPDALKLGQTLKIP